VSTTEQRKAMIAAFDAGDDVRAITIALQVCASMAREGNTSGAISIRNEVDMAHADAHRKAEHRKLRLEIAARLFAYDANATPGGSINAADLLIATNDATPVPKLPKADK